MLYGEGGIFQTEVRKESDSKMRQIIANMNADDLNVSVETLLGAPYAEITHAVQQEGYDLVIVGTRGLSAWEQFFVGSTAKRLIRNCPSSVWIVNSKQSLPPKTVLAATDFSDVSRRAVLEGLFIARQAGADFHLLHVVDSMDVPEEFIDRIPAQCSTRNEVNKEAQRRLSEFIESLQIDSTQVHLHLSYGYPWQEVGRLASHLNADLIALGTVGRSGVKGILLGNTAERILDTCQVGILTVKPSDYVSPIMPPFWSLHPPTSPTPTES
jgi:nucleotide-binding universal stress UspA family protein